MGKWLRARSCPPDNHLPPAEITPLLVATRDKVHAPDKLDMKLDEFGVPDAVETVRLLAAHIGSAYEWPRQTNVHHLCWPRRSYADHIEMEYRNDPTVMAHIPIQFHNLWHEAMLPPDMPDREVMIGRVNERRRSNNLFEIGRRAIRFERWSEMLPIMTNDTADSRWMEDTMSYYETRGRIDRGAFYRYLDLISDGEYGILPDREQLASSRFEDAVATLGRLAAVEAIDLRRTVQELTAA